MWQDGDHTALPKHGQYNELVSVCNFNADVQTMLSSKLKKVPSIPFERELRFGCNADVQTMSSSNLNEVPSALFERKLCFSNDQNCSKANVAQKRVSFCEENVAIEIETKLLCESLFVLGE